MRSLYRAIESIVALLLRNDPIKRRWWQLRSSRFEAIIERYSVETEDFFVLQVGACDGVMADPIHKWIKKYNWRGILVEPQQNEFERLRINYRDNSKLSFENVAIAGADGLRPFFRVKDERIEAEWQRGVASLVATPKFVREDMVVTEMVRCITFNTLLNRHHVERIDLLQIDVEGYDYELLKSFDFERIRPRLIRYEHLHLTGSDRRSCRTYLKREGYEILEMKYDTGAILRRG
jgi:FkbM family methyltransferase